MHKDVSSFNLISNPRESQIVIACREWAKDHQVQGNIIVVSEIADYEVRRELLRADKLRGVQRLDFSQTVIRIFADYDCRNAEGCSILGASA